MKSPGLRVPGSAVVLGLLACGEEVTTRPAAGPPLAAVSGGAALQAQVNSLINALFAPKDQGAIQKDFARIKNAVASGRTAEAQTAVVAFVKTLLAASDNDLLQDPNGARPPSIPEALQTLVNSVAQFADLPPPIPTFNPFQGDGAIAVVGPTGGTVVSSTGFGGAGFPPGALPADVIVVVERLPNPVVPGAGPLPTGLTQFPLFYDFTTSPHVAQFGADVTVGICQLEVGDPFGPPTQAVANRLQLAHPDPANPTTIELLPRQLAAFVDCNNVTLAQALEPRTWSGKALAHLVSSASRVLSLFRPSVAWAVHGGLGGLTRSFSPFAAVEPISIGPAGGTVTSADGNLTLTIPPGALSVATTIGVTALASYPADPRVTPGAVYELTPVGLQFAQPATLRLKYSPTAVPGGSFRAHGLRLGTVNNAGRWTVDLATQPSVATTDLTAPISHFSVYGLLVATDRVAASTSAKDQTTCSLTSSLSLSCWGGNGSGQLGDGTTIQHFSPQSVSGAGSFVQVSAGGRHTCGLLVGGAASCWGLDWFGSLGDGVGQVSHSVPTAVVGGHLFVKLAIGFEHSCGLTSSGSAYCWGDNQLGELGIGTQGLTNQPTPLAVSGGHTFVDIAAGAWRTCGITDTADLFCWGYVYGPVAALVPSLVPGGLKWSSVSIGGGLNNVSTHTCGVSTDGKGYCWGSNHKGELGDPSLPLGGLTSAPNLVVGGHSFVSIAAGGEVSCGLETTGQVYCWGDNSLGALGDGSPISARATPGLASLQSPALSVSGNGTHVCAETVAGQLYCWGDNSTGGLGIGTSAIQFSPAPLLGGLSFSALASGAPQCGLVGGQAYCWGPDPGNGTSFASGGPVAVSSGALTAISSGGATSCGLASGGSLSCWGNNLFGQFGNGATTPSLTPVAAGSGQLFSKVSIGLGLAGGIHTCGITTVGVTLCWGSNIFGELGDGSGSNNSDVPVPVAGAPSFTAISAGSSTTCGLTATNDVFCWGGISFSLPATPVPLVGTRKFSSITVGRFFGCGIELGTAQAFCWGRRNAEGQLGNGTFTPSQLTPVAVAGGLSFLELAAGEAHACGVTTLGQAYCWGDRRGGGVGDGVITGTFAPQPVLVPGITAVSVRAGHNASCVRTAGGAVSCWGDNALGRLGVASDWFRNTPVLVP